jgi:trehalose 6-phosphate synthase/phosphatase
MDHAHGSSSPSQVSAATERIRGAPRAILLLDYDGTLVPFVERPERARPDRPLLALLGELAAQPGREVHLVSGRPREDLERWFGTLPLGLHAEHGYWSRERGGAWTAAGPAVLDWRGPVLALMRAHAARTPGAHVEEKSVGLAWHHRAAEPSAGAAQARALERRLAALLADGPAEVLIGDQVVEVRPRGVEKGGVVRRLAGAAPEALLVALGDDRTDEDMFAALPPGGLAVHVGQAPSGAGLRLRGVAEARAFLRALVAPVNAQ